MSAALAAAAEQQTLVAALVIVAVFAAVAVTAGVLVRIRDRRRQPRLTVPEYEKGRTR